MDSVLNSCSCGGVTALLWAWRFTVCLTGLSVSPHGRDVPYIDQRGQYMLPVYTTSTRDIIMTAACCAVLCGLNQVGCRVCQSARPGARDTARVVVKT